jgi:hypothetical protein
MVGKHNIYRRVTWMKFVEPWEVVLTFCDLIGGRLGK